MPAVMGSATCHANGGSAEGFPANLQSNGSTPADVFPLQETTLPSHSELGQGDGYNTWGTTNQVGRPGVKMDTVW